MGNDRKIRVGEDPWVRCNQQHMLPDHTVEALRQRGIVYLSQLAAPFQENPWFQTWKSALDFKLPLPDERELNHFLKVLIQAQIQLSERDDVLIWDLDSGGRYTPKAGYIKLSVDGFQRVMIWWWKINCPPKARLFMWCVLENKVSVWDNLQKRCFNGPR